MSSLPISSASADMTRAVKIGCLSVRRLTGNPADRQVGDAFMWVEAPVVDVMVAILLLAGLPFLGYFIRHKWRYASNQVPSWGRGRCMRP